MNGCVMGRTVPLVGLKMLRLRGQGGIGTARDSQTIEGKLEWMITRLRLVGGRMRAWLLTKVRRVLPEESRTEMQLRPEPARQSGPDQDATNSPVERRTMEPISGPHPSPFDEVPGRRTTMVPSVRLSCDPSATYHHGSPFGRP